jgi:hypothetical protein
MLTSGSHQLASSQLIEHRLYQFVKNMKFNQTLKKGPIWIFILVNIYPLFFKKNY